MDAIQFIDHGGPLVAEEIHDNTRIIRFEGDFNHPILPGDIPLHITSVTFGRQYTQPLRRGAIHEKTRYLGLENGSFNKEPLKDILPPIKTLFLSNRKNYHPSSDDIPESVSTLYLDANGEPFDLTGLVPKSVRSLTLLDFKTPFHENELPTTIDSFTVMGNIDCLNNPKIPPNIIRLRIKSYPLFDPRSVNKTISLKNLNLPESIELSITGSPDSSISIHENQIPDHITSLRLERCEWNDIDIFPSQIKELSINLGDDSTSARPIPPVETLTLRGDVHKIKPGYIPQFVKTLILDPSPHFSSIPDNIIPDTVEEIKVWSLKIHTLSDSNIPSNLKSLSNHSFFIDKLDPENILDLRKVKNIIGLRLRGSFGKARLLLTEQQIEELILEGGLTL